jgi:hypothetical protein
VEETLVIGGGLFHLGRLDLAVISSPLFHLLPTPSGLLLNALTADYSGSVLPVLCQLLEFRLLISDPPLKRDEILVIHASTAPPNHDL